MKKRPGNTNCIVMIQRSRRHKFRVEESGVSRPLGAVMAACRVGVLASSTDSVELGEVFGGAWHVGIGPSHRCEWCSVVGCLVDRSHRRGRGALDSARQPHSMVTGPDCGGSVNDRGEAASTLPIHGSGRNTRVESGCEGRHASDVSARSGAVAQDDITHTECLARDVVGVVTNCTEDGRCELVRSMRLEGSSESGDGGATSGDNDRISQGLSPPRIRRVALLLRGQLSLMRSSEVSHGTSVADGGSV